MKKLLLFSALFLIAFSSFSQQSQSIDPADTSVYYWGIYTQAKIFGSKDSTATNSKSYFRSYASKFQVNSVNAYNLTAGTPPNVLSADDSGVVKRYSFPVISPTFSTPSRTLSTTGSNNTFTISSTRAAIVHYTVDFSAALTLTTSNGNVSLDYSLDGGSTWINVSRVTQTFGVSVTITTSQSNVLSGVIPANALIRINRVSNTNVTITLPAGTNNYQQEILL